LLYKYTAFAKFVKTAAVSRMDHGQHLKNLGFMHVSSWCPPKTRYSWRGSRLRFVDSFLTQFLSMNIKPNHSTSHRGKRPEKSGLLSLSQISELMAQGAVSQHQMLSEAHSSQVYATDLDEFVDFHAWQSVNVNPSTQQGIHQ
jgi:hypothetical protein